MGGRMHRIPLYSILLLFVAQSALAEKLYDDRLIVKFAEGIGAESLSGSGYDLMFEERLDFIEAAVYRPITMADGLNPFSIALDLMAREDIAYAEPNYRYEIIEQGLAAGPNDPEYQKLYGLRQIKATEAWQRSVGSREVVVAVIDTGVDFDHEDLAGNIFENNGELGVDKDGKDRRFNKVDDDNNGFVDDWRGWDFQNQDNEPFDDHMHGTHCSGTIGAVGDNGKGVVGVNWEISILPIKFLDGNGGSLVDAIKSIEYATVMGVDVMSNSWGGGGFGLSMLEAITRAGEKGILFVAAAGNKANNNDTQAFYPATYKTANMISVAAGDDQEKLASFSNFGRTTVHVLAPGVNILSTVPGNLYKAVSGTSMATPHVSGFAALLKAIDPELSMHDLRNKILGSTRAVPAVEGKVLTNGMIDFGGALENDTSAPGKIDGFTVTGAGLDHLGLAFAPAGDDGPNGSATIYEVRGAEEAIADESAWAEASVLATLYHPVSKNGIIELLLRDLPLNTSLQLAVRAYDNVLNASPISKSLGATTSPLTVVSLDKLETPDSFIGEGLWVHTKALAYSGEYSWMAKGTKAAKLISKPIALPENYQRIYVNHRQRFGGATPSCLFYVSGPDGKWQRVAQPSTQTYGWVGATYDLTDFVKGQKSLSFMLYFSAYKDESTFWAIDDFGIFVK